MLCGQSKLESVVANLALQHVQTVEAATIKEFNNCSIELIELLIMLNLILTILLVLAKLRKSKVFQGHIFTNMVKIKLFLANTQSYVPLELNSAAGNVHLFKLSGTNCREIHLKEKLDMGCVGNKLGRYPCNIK